MSALPTTEKFDRLYRSLMVEDVRRELAPYLPSGSIPMEDMAYMLSVATRLALSGGGDSLENAFAGRRAYEVAIRSLNFANGSTPVVRATCELILSRIGNFPARRLLREQAPAALETMSDPFLATETMVREYENTIRGTGSETVLTDFQVRLIRSLEANQSVSVSAPTSSGKSFTLEFELLRRLKDDESYVGIFIVPTRALIRQVTFDLVKILREHDLVSIPVLSAPTTSEKLAHIRKLIYVLTQERAATLLTSNDAKLRVDAIIVDEAHEIGESSGRGLTLERVIALVLRRFPNARLFFSSPLRSNPGFLLQLFGREQNGEHFVEYLSPVTQNIMNVHKVPGRGNTDNARMELVVEKDTVPLGTAKLPFTFRGSYMGKFAYHFTKPGDTSIVYCNEPGLADKVAQEISKEIEVESDDPDLISLADFLRHEVHHLYRLAPLIRKGVAFHYGNIPQIIRGRVEELLRDRKLRFVCCTSTLLQGINLPAKNIFLEDPKKGRGSSMKKGDFWNLIGRAGRLSKEFQGNVFCIFGKEWESDATSEPLVSIESAFDVAIKERTAELVEVVKQPPESSESKQSWAEQVFARIYSDYISSGRRLVDSANEQTRERFATIDAASTGFAKSLPNVIFENNFYVHPARLESLAAFFRQQQDLRLWIPGSPYARHSYYRLLPIFELIERLFIRSGTQVFKYHTVLALHWMQGASLKKLVADKIERSGAAGDIDKINDAIRRLFDDLENELRYRYVKYTRIYTDVLRAVLSERGLVKEADALLPLYLFLEYGAANQTLINLMAIGLSRTSALLLKPALGLREDLSAEDCQRHLDAISIDRIDLPALCKSEIVRLRRSTV